MTKPSNVSHEQRVAWGRMGGLIGAANQTANQRKLSATIAANARAAKYTHEELSQKYAGCLTRILARMPPEQAAEVRRKAGQKRWEGVSAEERSKLARKAIQTRLARAAYAKDPEAADRLFGFLDDFVTTKGYPPTLREICKTLHHDSETARKLLQMLEAAGKMKRHDRKLGIVLSTFTTGHRLEISPCQTHIADERIMPRSSTKCYDCDAPAVKGRTRCEMHLAKVRASSNRSHERKRRLDKRQPR